MAKLGDWTCPSGKIPHLTRDAAEGQRRALVSSRRGSGMHVYRCDHCGNWHVGHPKGIRWKQQVQRRGGFKGDLPKCS